MSKTRVDLPSVPAGNLAFISGLRNIAVGDTLIGKRVKGFQPISSLQYPTEPVVTYTIEPKKLSELGNIQEPIEEYVNTDPALEFEVNPETGEMLISGAGELHIEITVEKLTRQGVEVQLGRPMVLLREQMTKDGTQSSGGSDRTSTFSLRVLLVSDQISPESFGTVLATDPGSVSWIVDASSKINPFGDEAEWIKDAFSSVLRSGVTSGERMRRVGIVIDKADIKTEGPETSWREITQPLIEAIRKSIQSGAPVVLEPWIHLEISSPEEYVGAVTAILSKRKGHVFEIDSERSLYRIEAEIPVRESFGLANEIRTSTSGWVTWGAEKGGYRDVKDSERRYD